MEKMILGKLALNEVQTISFGINVFGTSQAPTDIRFIIENESFDIVCKCKQNGDDLEVNIPQLKGILESKKYQTRLEVIIGDKIFTPLRESIEFNPLVEFGVQKKTISLVKEGVEIKVNATSSETKKTKLQENIELVKNDYEIREINGFNVLVKNEKYHGFVNETTIVEAGGEGYDTLAELVEALSK